MQKVPVASHDVHQLEEALTLPPAPGPAAPIRASPPHDSPALQQQAVHAAEPTVVAADEQPVGMQALQDGAASSAGPAEAPGSGQPEGSLALQQAPAPEATAQLDTQEVPASEAVSSGGASSKRVEVEDKPAPPMPWSPNAQVRALANCVSFVCCHVVCYQMLL